MSVKNKTLLLITTILAIFSVSLFYLVKLQQNERIEGLKKLDFENTKNSYENISKKYRNYYEDIVLYDFSSIEIKSAIINRDKELLYKLSADKYKILQKHNSDLIIMNFHTPDNTLLLDMNKPKSSDKINDSFLITKVHKNHKNVFGYEQGEDYIAYKSIHPIFYDNEYIGAIELGININYVLTDMQTYANIDGLIFSKYKGRSSLSLSTKTTTDKEIVDTISRHTINKIQETIYSRRGNAYTIYTFDIKNTEQLPVARLHFMSNITKEMSKLEEDLQILLIFLASMVAVTLIIINFSLGRSVKTLQESFDNLYEYMDMIDNNIMMVDVSSDFKIIGVSQRFCDISGYKKDELFGEEFDNLKDPNSSEELYKSMHEELKKSGKWSGDLQNRTKDGEKYWLSTTIEAKKKNGVFVCYNCIMHNITAKKMNEELIFIDELTNTYNRKYFKDTFPRMVNGIKRNGGCINFIVLDIDDFKKYNEEYGHTKGDEALVLIANTLVKSLRRPDDYCFRLGGGEFGILFRSGSEDEGNLYAQVLRKNIEMIGIKHKHNLVHKVLTASLGLVSLESHKISDDKDIYSRAYEHLLRAKEDGRNKVISKLI